MFLRSDSISAGLNYCTRPLIYWLNFSFLHSLPRPLPRDIGTFDFGFPLLYTPGVNHQSAFPLDQVETVNKGFDILVSNLNFVPVDLREKLHQSPGYCPPGTCFYEKDAEGQRLKTA
jgi:hypothetical protein